MTVLSMSKDTETVVRRSRKRQRILTTHQSKFGCFTCKLRRVKCDESKPICLRCIRSDRHCDGYPVNAPNLNPSSSSSSSSTSSQYDSRSTSSTSPSIDLDSPQRSPPSHIAKSLETTSYLVSLGCHVFIADRSSRQDGPGTTFTSTILPNLCYSFPIVASAATLFGASYEARVLRKSLYSPTVATMYTGLLKHLQQSIEIRQDGILPLLVACSLIAASDTILRRHDQALLHLEGALALFSLDGKGKELPTEVLRFLQSLDLLASTLALQRPLTLPATSPDDLDLCFTDINRADSAVMDLLQVCYNFTATASHFKYVSQKDVPTQIMHDQTGLVSKLTLCLESLEIIAPMPEIMDATTPDGHSSGHISLLRAQCLGSLIYVSTILDPRELAYDKYNSLFKLVVDNVDNALRTIHSTILASNHPLPRFSPSPGINSSLCLTAHKCRDGTIRRKAAALMLQAGIEGPWDGAVEARLANRIIEIEEYGFGRVQDLDTPLNPSILSIPEKARISGVSILHENVESNAAGLRTAQARFSQCVDVERMITGKPHFSHASHWRYWMEEILVP